jgi:hypothetical protein
MEEVYAGQRAGVKMLFGSILSNREQREELSLRTTPPPAPAVKK